MLDIGLGLSLRIVKVLGLGLAGLDCLSLNVPQRQPSFNYTSYCLHEFPLNLG